MIWKILVELSFGVKFEKQQQGLGMWSLVTSECVSRLATIPLKNWVWSGSVGAPRSDLYTHKTMFTPEAGKTYFITIAKNEGNLKAPKAEFLLMGGGWKAF